MNITTYSLFIIFPILLSYVIATFSGQKMVTQLPISYFLATFWAFGFGLADRLLLGVYLLFPALFVVISLMLIFKKGFINRERMLELTSPAMVAFLFLSAWTFVNSRNMRFYAWDEFSGWGPFVKSIFLLDKLGPYSPIDLPFPEYLSGISILPYLAMKIGGEWDESVVYWSYQVLIVAILVAMFPAIKWKRYGLNLIVLISSLLAATFFYNSFQSVYADPMLGLLFGLGIITATSRDLIADKWSYFNFVVLVTFVSMTKEIGIYFSLSLILVMFAKMYFVFNDPDQKRNFPRLIRSLGRVCIALLPLAALQIFWKTILSNQEITSSRSIFAIIKKVFGESNQSGLSSLWSDEVFTNFSNKTFASPITNINGLPLTSVMWIAILMMLIGLLILSTKQRKIMLEDSVTLITLSLGFFGYLVALFFSYLTVFSAGEAAGVASYERYIATYFAGIVIYLNFRFMQEIYSKSTISSLSFFTSAWIVVLLMQSSPSNVLTYLSNPNTASNNFMSQFDGERRLIKDMNLKVSDDVWIIAQHTVGFEFYLFNYELLPASVGRSPFSIGSSYGEGDIWTDTSYTQEKWVAKLNDFEYVFIHKVTPSFVDEFGSLFDDPESLDAPGFYRVNMDFDGLNLTRVP